MTLKERLELRKRLLSRVPTQGSVDPDQPLPQPDMTQQYPEGAVETRNVAGSEQTPNQYPTVADLPYEGIAETAGAGIGGMIGGPPGAASGYALADLLYDKYNKGQEITPSAAAKSLGMGAAMEVLPAGAMRAVGGGLQRAGRRIYQKAYRPPTSQVKSDQKLREAMKYGMDNRIVPSAGGLEANAREIDRLTSIVDSYIDEATAAGKKIKTDDVLKAVDESEGSRLINDHAFGKERAADLNTFKENVKENVGEFMTPTQAQAAKREYGRLVADAYDTNVKSAKTRTMRDYAHGAKAEIEKAVPGVIPLNKEASQRTRLNNLIASRVRTQENQPLIGGEDVVRYAIGGMPYASGMRAINAPSVVARSGLATRGVGKGVSAAAPPSGIPTLISQSLREKRTN